MLTRTQKQLLLTKALDDRRFRARFLARPKEEARKLGIELTAAEVRKIRATAAVSRRNAEAYDRVRQFFKVGKPIKPAFLPLLPVLM